MNNTCVLGTGIDLVENERMKEVIERWGARFVDKVFLPDEQEYCRTKAAPHRHYAGRFAVKEAVSKAFGTGLGPHIGLLDIEVIRNKDTGAPSIKLSEKALKLAGGRNAGDVLISLSHTRSYAVAHAFLVRQ
ncbi:MAG: holo-ACP synthase [Kiritimatiellae bacterium]|nr:holo-ACP synthase [Kiritimatiellia bacterium]